MEMPLIAAVSMHYLNSTDVTHGRRTDHIAAVREFQRWAGAQCTIDLLRDGVNEYLTELLDNHELAPSTVNKRRVIYNTLLRHAVDGMGLALGPVKVKHVKVPPPLPVCFTHEELTLLDDHATPLQRAAIRLAYDTGLRRENLLKTTWDQLRLHPEVILAVRQAKNQRPIPCRLRAETLCALREVENKNDRRLVPWPTNKDWDHHWHALGKRASVDVNRRGLHAIRKSGASYSEREGLSASHYLGHADADSVKHYLDPRIALVPAELPPSYHQGPKLYREDSA